MACVPGVRANVWVVGSTRGWRDHAYTRSHTAHTKAEVSAAYSNVAGLSNSMCAPFGNAMLLNYLWVGNATYNGDEIHPSLLTQYTNACVMCVRACCSAHGGSGCESMHTAPCGVTTCTEQSQLRHTYDASLSRLLNSRRLARARACVCVCVCVCMYVCLCLCVRTLR